MKWTHKQLKNSTASFLGSALLLASCLVGLPRAASAQGTPLSDVTLEQFMSALEARYSNTVQFEVDSEGLVSTDGSFVQIVTVPFDPDSFDTIGTILKDPYGEYIGNNAYYMLEWLRSIALLLESPVFSNALDRVRNFMGSSYDGQSGTDVDSWLTTLAASLNDIDLGVGNPQFDAIGIPQSQAPFAVQTYDLATPFWLTAHTGDLGDDPVEQVLFVQDPLAADKLDDLIDGQSDLADIYAQGMPIAEDSLYQMGEEIRVALEDVLPDLFGDSVGASLTDDPRNALTNMASSERSIMDTEGLIFTNAVYSVTGNVNQLLGSVDVGAISNDFRSLLGAFLPNSGRSTVLQLTPSMSISTRPDLPAVVAGPIEVDLADSRFTVGGWPLWQVLRALCILGWWAWWFWFMYGFLHKWISKFASLMGS